MPQVPVNYLAVLGAAIASMVIGALWYGPLFGKAWVNLAGMTEAQMNAAKQKGMGKSYAIMFAGSFLMAYVLLHALVFASAYLGAYGAVSGLIAGFWNWLGFVAPVTLGAVLWECKPWKLWLINNGYYLVVLLVMGMILAVWK